MVAKISVGSSLYGAIAYNGEKINEAQGRLLTTNRIYNDGSGKVDIGKAMEGFHTYAVYLAIYFKLLESISIY